MKRDRLPRVALLGYIVRGPIGGLAWHHLQYLLALQRLGYDVMFLEDSGDEAWSCYDPERGVTDRDCSYGLAWAARLFDAMGLGEAWAFYDAGEAAWTGPGASRAAAHIASADIILNLSGSNVLREAHLAVPIRAYVDTDPVFTQVKNLTDADHASNTHRHTCHFTFAENWGGDATIPDDGLAWMPTRQPVVADVWDLGPAPARGSYSTVMQWTSYPPVEFEGRRFGLKSDTFEAFRDLPARVTVELELALGSSDAPREDLARRGWKITDPLEVTRDAFVYQDFIAASRGEFTVAKDGYVSTRSGWFSERSANYLAAGRPVVAQDTAYDSWLPTGHGLFSVRNVEEAQQALLAIEADYAHHVDAAREIARWHFDAGDVLERLFDAADVG